MIKLSTLAIAVLFSTPALAQSVQNVPPSPGTIEDPNFVFKQAADGPPRSLIRMDAPVKSKQIAVSENITRH